MIVRKNETDKMMKTWFEFESLTINFANYLNSELSLVIVDKKNKHLIINKIKKKNF